LKAQKGDTVAIDLSGGTTPDEYESQKGNTVANDMSGGESKQLFADVTESYLQSLFFC
jgi:hypothetical protein